MTVPSGSGTPDARPLAGRSIVVTRARAQASVLVERLTALGAEVIEVPVIETVDPIDGGQALREALLEPGRYAWLVVTSPNGARRLGAALDTSSLDPDADPPRVAVVGPATAAALEPFGIAADLIPERSVAEGLLDAFPSPPAGDDGGRRVLLAQADRARPVLADGLRAVGWTVDVVTAYRTVAAAIADADRARIDRADIVTFTSASTVANFVEAVGVDACPGTIASIGPITSARASELGLHVDAEADPHTIEGLVAAIVATAGA